MYRPAQKVRQHILNKLLAGSHYALSPINEHLVLSVKRTGYKDKSMTHVLYILRLVKRHIPGQSDVEQ